MPQFLTEPAFLSLNSSKKEYVVCYILTEPDSPIQISGIEAIIEALGADKIAKIESGKFGFFDLE